MLRRREAPGQRLFVGLLANRVDRAQAAVDDLARGESCDDGRGHTPIPAERPERGLYPMTCPPEPALRNVIRGRLVADVGEPLLEHRAAQRSPRFGLGRRTRLLDF